MQLVLLVADADVGRVRRALEAAGCETIAAAGPRDAEHVGIARPVDALVFDFALAGAELRERLRTQKPTLPQIAWLPSSSAAATADLFLVGADEVLNGGMGDAELAARTVATAKRGGTPAASVVEIGALRIDPDAGEAAWHGRLLPLTRRERQVLRVLAESAGRAIAREALYRKVWGYAMARGDRTVDVNVKRLRAKLAAATDGAVAISTQTGVGYRLEIEAAAATVTPL